MLTFDDKCRNIWAQTSLDRTWANLCPPQGRLLFQQLLSLKSRGVKLKIASSLTNSAELKTLAADSESLPLFSFKLKAMSKSESQGWTESFILQCWSIEDSFSNSSISSSYCSCLTTRRSTVEAYSSSNCWAFVWGSEWALLGVSPASTHSPKTCRIRLCIVVFSKLTTSQCFLSICDTVLNKLWVIAINPHISNVSCLGLQWKRKGFFAIYSHISES